MVWVSLVDVVATEPRQTREDLGEESSLTAVAAKVASQPETTSVPDFGREILELLTHLPEGWITKKPVTTTAIPITEPDEEDNEEREEEVTLEPETTADTTSEVTSDIPQVELTIPLTSRRECGQGEDQVGTARNIQQQDCPITWLFEPTTSVR